MANLYVLNMFTISIQRLSPQLSISSKNEYFLCTISNYMILSVGNQLYVPSVKHVSISSSYYKYACYRKQVLYVMETRVGDYNEIYGMVVFTGFNCYYYCFVQSYNLMIIIRYLLQMVKMTLLKDATYIKYSIFRNDLVRVKGIKCVDIKSLCIPKI